MLCSVWLGVVAVLAYSAGAAEEGSSAERCQAWSSHAAVKTPEEFAAIHAPPAKAGQDGAAEHPDDEVQPGEGQLKVAKPKLPLYMPQEPLHIHGMATPPVLDNFSIAELQDFLGETVWERRSTPRRSDQRMSVKDYMQSTPPTNTSGEPLYISGFKKDVQLQRMFRYVPPMFRGLRRSPLAVFAVPGQGMSLHMLPEPRWMQQVVGRAVVSLMRPEEMKKWMEQKKDTQGCSKKLRKAAGACEVVAGEAIYVPGGWGWASCALASDDKSAPQYSFAVGFGGYTIGWPEHFHSIAEGDIKQLKSQLQADPTLVHTADGGMRNTAIELASAIGDVRAVKLLHSFGGKHNDTGSLQKMYPLHLASAYGQTEVAEYLLKEGANPDATTKEEKTALHLAAEAGHADIVRLLLKAKGRPHASFGTQKLTPMHLAAQNGHVGVLKALRDGGADLSVGDAKGCEPPILALFSKSHAAVLDFLYGEEGLNPNSQCSKGKAAAHIAAEAGLTEVLDVLKRNKANMAIKDDDKHSPLHRAVVLEVMPVIHWYANSGLKKINPKTPGLLHTAAWANKMESAKLLLQLGANISALEPHGGAMAIELAASAEMLTMLLEAGDGHVPIEALHRAANHGQLFFLREMANRRPSIIEDLRKEHNGFTAVHGAASGGHADVLAFMCDQHGLDCKVKTSFDNHRQSPLHLVCAGEGEMRKNARLQAAQYLVRYGNVVDDYDFHGMTPLEFAGAMGHLSIVKFLVLEQEADIGMLWRAKREKYLKPEIDRWLTSVAKKDAYDKWMEHGWPAAGPGAIPTGKVPWDSKNQLKKQKPSKKPPQWSQAEPDDGDEDDDDPVDVEL
mmetsp:Transcript_8728/g.15751  ORF Transcript_8728/g.15751 Transcript_8728/m.15751 type:complete len:843 (+) Transcript_8728:89-2617(+)